jgi:hypothetical protein
MTHSGRPARVDHGAFKLDKLRDRPADEINALDPVQRPEQALAIAEVCNGGGHSCRCFGRILLVAVHGPHRQSRGQRRLQNGAAGIAGRS